jgi:hypothetical protein
MINVQLSVFKSGMGTSDYIYFCDKQVAERHDGSVHCCPVCKDVADKMLAAGIPLDELDGISSIDWKFAKKSSEAAH